MKAKRMTDGGSPDAAVRALAEALARQGLGVQAIGRRCGLNQREAHRIVDRVRQQRALADQREEWQRRIRVARAASGKVGGP